MSATTVKRFTKFAGHYPTVGTAPVAANTLILGGTLVSLDSSGNAVPCADGNGLRAYGKAVSTIDNRTGSENGGAAGAVNVDVDFGIHEFECADTDLRPGDLVYVVDNQTASKSSSGGTRGVLGVHTEVGADGKKYFLIGPSVASVLGSVGTETIHIPINSFRVAAGTMPAAFNDGVADGYVVNEGSMYRWNVNSTAAIWASAFLPADLDESRDVVINMLVSREGSSDTDAVVTVTAFLIGAGAAYTADSNTGGNTGAIDTATTVVKQVSRTIAAADVPAGPVVLTFSLVPSALLNADDLNLHAVWVTYTRKG